MYYTYTLSLIELIHVAQALNNVAILYSDNSRSLMITGHPSATTNKQSIDVTHPPTLCSDFQSSKTFQSGWIGINGYDDDLFFAGLYSWSINYNFDTNQVIVYFSNRCPKDLKNSLLKLLEESSGEKQSEVCISFTDLSWEKSQSKERYASNLNKIKSYIKAGDCYQVNLTQRFEASCGWNKRQAIHAFFNSAINSHADYCAFIEIADNHFVASISPEQFIECDHGTMMTKPIKGTVKSTGRITKEQTSELQNSKNRAENLMIVDLLRNDLSKVSRLHSVNVTKLFDIESFNNVHHLVSTITSEIDCSKHTPFTAFLSAFPGGSITGAPKKRAQEIITELEAHPRRFYCGSIFMWDNDLDKFQSNILIRTVEIEKKKAFCWGGGGIVADSQLDEEYMESLNKIAHITGKLIET